MKTLVVLLTSALAQAAPPTDICIVETRNYAAAKAKYDSGGEGRLLIQMAARAGFREGGNDEKDFVENLKTRTEIRRLNEQIRISAINQFKGLKNAKTDLERLKQEALSLQSTAAFKKLEKADPVASERSFDRAIKAAEGNSSIEELKALIAPATQIKRKSAKFHRYTQAGSNFSSLATEFISAVGTTKEHLKKLQADCGAHLSLDDVRFLGHYINNNDHVCEFSVTGANALATATNEELASVCKAAPSFGGTAEGINQRWQKKVAQLPAPSEFQLNCKNGKMTELGFSMVDHQRTYRLDNTGKTVKITIQELDKQKSFSFETTYLPEKEEFGSVHLVNVEGLKNREGKDFKKFRDSVDRLPLKEGDRRRFDVGESLLYFEGLYPEAQRTCVLKNL